MIQIAPSLPAAEFARLGEALDSLKRAGALMIHIDVMDGHFVPELSIGQPVIKSLRRVTDLVLDLHLLIERPERYVAEFAKIGVERMAVHAESTPNLSYALGLVRSAGSKAGVALNPATDVDSVSDVLSDVDYLLVLAASMGFASSSYRPSTVGKVQEACELRKSRQLSFQIEVEGCLTEKEIDDLADAGADILVADSDILQKDPKSRWSQLLRQSASVS